MSGNPATPAQPPLHGTALYTAVFATALCNFISVLDLTIANVSIPHIAAGLGASPREGSWVLTSYAVAEAVVVPLTGWLSVRFGPVRMLTVCIASFGLFSALCGLATSMQMLVIFRLMQGVVGGPMMPLSQAIMFTLFPVNRRGTGVTIWTLTSVMGPILGPTIGGQITTHFSWHWIFLVNVPFALLVASVVPQLLAGRDPPPQHRPVDLVGLGLMVTWIGAIQYILDRGQDLDWFGSRIIVLLCIVAAIGFCAFLIWELTERHPIVNLHVFRSRSYSIGVIVSCLGFGAYFSSTVLQPLWMQTNMGYTATWAGLAAAPPAFMMILTSPLVGWLTNRMDARYLMSFGLFCFALALVWRGEFASNVDFQHIIMSQLMFGTCLSLFVSPAMTMTMTALQPDEFAGGAGLMSFSRTTAIAFGTALTTTAWQDATINGRSGIVDRLAGDSALAQLQAAGIPAGEALHMLDDIVQSEAVMLATNHAYFLFAMIMTAAGIIVWLAPRTYLGAAGKSAAAH
jgi:DHA2 family multidrug resistance protein